MFPRELPDRHAALPPEEDPDGLDERLLGQRPFQILVEFTGRCNLRCIYCAVSQPTYVARDLELEREALIEQLVALGPIEFQINGHGETTLVKDWHVMADALLKRGLDLTLISHLNKDMSDEEISVLARLKWLTVSCDTRDPAIYQRLRRGGRLDRIERNVRRIFELCRVEGRKPTYVSFNCTVTHINVLGIPELVTWAADMGLSAVSLTNLEEYPEIPGVEKPLHPSKVDPVGGLAALRTGREIARARGLDYWLMSELEDTLADAARQKLAS